MSSIEPTRRPALRKSADAHVHPTLVPDQDSGDFRKRKGSTTSDTLRDPRGEKTVDVTIAMPKALRKQLKKEAKRQGMSVQDLILMLLQPPSRG
jgi:NAD(P)H-flavin reductase